MAQHSRTQQPPKPAPNPQPTSSTTPAQPPRNPKPIFTDYASI